MPKVYHKKRANKDYPQFNVWRGQEYWEWKFYGQKPQKSPRYPTRSQLTQSEYKKLAYDVYDDKVNREIFSHEDMRAKADQLDEASALAQGQFDDMNENFQQSESAQAMEQAASDLSAAADQVRDIADRMEAGELGLDEALEELYETEVEV